MLLIGPPSHDDVFTISYTTKVRIYHFLMMFVDVGNHVRVQFIQKKITCSSHLQLKTPKNASLQIRE